MNKCGSKKQGTTIAKLWIQKEEYSQKRDRGRKMVKKT